MAMSAIHHACKLRFRPVLMTTAAAVPGGLPLALRLKSGFGVADVDADRKLTI